MGGAPAHVPGLRRRVGPRADGRAQRRVHPPRHGRLRLGSAVCSPPSRVSQSRLAPSFPPTQRRRCRSSPPFLDPLVPLCLSPALLIRTFYHSPDKPPRYRLVFDPSPASSFL